MAGGKGKTHGGKASGGAKTGSGGGGDGKVQQSHSAKAGLQVSYYLLGSVTFFSFIHSIHRRDD